MPVEGTLAAYLTLLHLVGVEAERQGSPPPWLQTDIFTLTNAMGPRLRQFLHLRGDTLVCPELGTIWPRAA